LLETLKLLFVGDSLDLNRSTASDALGFLGIPLRDSSRKKHSVAIWGSSRALTWFQAVCSASSSDGGRHKNIKEAKE
jgi:hypothetical protein